MKTLLWKDYRQNRKLLVGIVILVLLPYFVGIGVAFVQEFPHGLSLGGLAELLGTVSAVGLVLASGMAAFIAGNAFAGERADRSAEFAGYLPIPRSRALMSKVLVALTACTGLQVPNLIVRLWTQFFLADNYPIVGNFLILTTTSTVLLFGVAWLISSFSSSPAIAAASALGIPLLLLLVRTLPVTRATLERAGSYPFLCVFIGLGCFIAGSIHYLRRVEP